MSEVVVKQRQSLLDVAIQYLGGIENVFALASENGISITDDLEAGSILLLPNITNKKIVSAYYVNGYIPATGITEEDNVLAEEGIEFWAIEYDFVIN